MSESQIYRNDNGINYIGFGGKKKKVLKISNNN